MKTIQDLKINETAKVVKLHGTSAVKRHIMDMGITKGTEVTLVRIAPMGDPIELIVRGYSLSIRASEAEEIEVE